MSSDEAMQEISKIRDANSMKHFNMSLDELKKESKKSLNWLLRDAEKNYKNQESKNKKIVDK